MQATQPEKTYDAALNEEMQKFYRAFAVAQTKMILHLIGAAGDTDELKRRAVEATARLEAIVIKNDPTRGESCEIGRTWNPITRECE